MSATSDTGAHCHVSCTSVTIGRPSSVFTRWRISRPRFMPKPRGDFTEERLALSNDDSNSLPHVFAKITSSNLRVPLFDDGSLDDISSTISGEQKSGDLVENDNIYTANMILGKQEKMAYLTIYCSSDGGFESLADLAAYNHINYSIPINVL